MRGDDQRRVDAAGQERGDRYVGHRLGTDRGEERAGRGTHGVGERAPPVGVRRDLLVLPQVMPLTADGETAPPRQGLNVRESGGRLRDVAETEEVITGLAVDFGPEPRQRQQRLHLTGKGPFPILDGEEQGLDPEAVAGEEQPAAPPVVDREGEDAPQPRHHALALVLIQVDEHFRVGGAPEAVPARLELGREGAVVVDLAVVDDQDRSVLVAHRLRAGGREVDQREAPVHQVAAFVLPVTLAVRPAMRQQRRRRGRPAGLRRELGGVEPAGYAAHRTVGDCVIRSRAASARDVRTASSLKSFDHRSLRRQAGPRPIPLWQLRYKFAPA